MYPVECVARGYLTGSGLLDYQSTGEVCGIALPRGLVEGSRLPEPIFTPATKAALGDHDENVSYDAVVSDIGAEAAARLRDLTLEVYARAERSGPRARHHPGRHQVRVRHPTARSTLPGEVVLGDEVLTPDSSRYWPADEWQPGRTQQSYDKQIVRNWLTSPASGWDRASGDRPPALPDGDRRADPLALRRGLRAADGGDVLRSSRCAPRPCGTASRSTTPSPISPTRATGPSGSRRCVGSSCSTRARPGSASAGATTPRSRMSPEMEITELETDVLWAESGRWRAIEADLTLRFAPHRGGCSVDAEFVVRGERLPATRSAGRRAAAGLFAVRSDLRRPGRHPRVGGPRGA